MRLVPRFVARPWFACALLAVLAVPVRVPAATRVDLGTGLRRDHLDFNVAGSLSGGPPNVLSELTWDDVRSVQVSGRVRHDLWRNTLLEGSLDYGWSYSGENQDSDYAGDNRTNEFSRSNNNGGGGHVADGSLAIGQRLRGALQGVTVLAGVARNQQYLKMTDGVQTIPDTGPFPGLDSSYDARWTGPWIGLDVRRQVSRTLSLNARVEGHVSAYSAKANWNLRDDFAQPVSFREKGTGYGAAVSLGADYTVSPTWRLGAQAGLHNYRLRNGKDTVYYSNGSQGITRLNEVNWDSAELAVQAKHEF